MNHSASTKFQGEPTTPSDVDGQMEFPVSQSFMDLSVEEQDIRREEWKRELTEIEYEVQTMRQVLAAKVKKSQELKRKLGITAWRELQDDISQGLRNVKENPTFQSFEEKVEEVSKAITSAPLYQKTAEGVKAGAEKTGSMFGGFTANLSAKIGAIKESETFRSLEEKVGSAYTNVKAKVVTTSSSSHDLDEALKEAEAQREAAGLASGSATGTPTTTPTQSEKPVA